ncbi:serine hydrolase [Tsukamurella soli]|uniref:serine hydrolase n=1 Tax=Tsukamurella soli TaxID=644556 RepID=UPI0031E6220A
MRIGRSGVVGILGVGVAAALVACSSGPPASESTTVPGPPSAGAQPPDAVPGVAIPAGRIDSAVTDVDGLARDLMRTSHIPGMAIAVVHDGKIVYAKGFGVRSVDTRQPVDADTVFPLASLSKPIAATVVAARMATGGFTWATPVHTLMPSFALADPYVTEHVTVGDLFAHRSGLPDHAGDLLEDLGYDRAAVLSRLRQLPLNPFRDSYAYTNFGLTAAAEAVAEHLGTDWATLARQAVFGPLGMTSTSSRYADFTARPDRTVGHVLVGGVYRVSPQQRDPDAQSPAGGVSSSATDVAKWMEMVLAGGSAGGRLLIPPDDLLAATSPQSMSAPPSTAEARGGFYGFGFNVTSSAAGRVVLSHSGAFSLGAATAFTLIPSADVGIVTLTNAAPIGVPETLDAEFADLVQFGAVQQDWKMLYRNVFAKMDQPSGMLVGVTAPAHPAPAGPLSTYTGRYDNAYYGPATVTASGDSLTLRLGPKNMAFPLRHWDGDTFVFTPPGENAEAGTISKATFDGDRLVLEYYDGDHLGTFTRPAG